LEVLKKNIGFTLIELIIVVFIITIVTAAVLPSFFNFMSKDIASDAQFMASAIRYLEDNSTNTGTDSEMVINLDGKTVSYKTAEKEETREIDSLYSVELTSGGLKENGEVTVHFSSEGLTEKLKFKLYDKSLAMDVVYNPYSARVIVEKGLPPDEEKSEKQGNHS
jgi:prepilin-type N-terminal cleavage/methylation domain-containing protein